VWFSEETRELSVSVEASPHVTLKEAADVLGVHYMTVYRYVRHGRLAAFKSGTNWLISVEDLEAFVDAAACEAEPCRVRHTPWDERFEARLLAGDLGGSWQVVDASLAAGSDLDDIYTEVVTPALESIGRRWEAGEIGVATEHRASAIASRVIGRLSHRMVRRGQSRGTVAVGTSAVEQHGLPVAMLADLLRGAGFDSVDLGCNLPAECFADEVGKLERLRAVVISATTSGFDDEVRTTVSAIRSRRKDVPIYVGGRAVTDADHAATLDADGYAADATGLITLLATQ
jgi:excisionase family DNA binding protein